MGAVLACEGLRKSFGDRLAVDDVSLEIAAGECYGLIGPNGAGKTTTISMICGLLPADAGSVTVAGTRIDHHTIDGRSHIGYVPQEIALYPELSAAENLRFFGRLQGMDKALLEERVASALTAVGLADRSKERVERFSGGMRRRANLAVGILHRPDLLVLDEPTVGVDPQSRNAIFELVEQLRGDGMAILYTTHYMEEAERLCERVGIIDEGRLVAEGTHSELVKRVGGTDSVKVIATADHEHLADVVRALPGVGVVTIVTDGVEAVAEDGRGLLRAILEATDRAGIAVDGVEVNDLDLEAVFLRLTGKALRD